MFPYPSGAGLHVGHPKGYVASDVIARKKMLEGYNVLHPMGFDTFGLGTEQYAIDHKMKPQVVAEQNIKTYISQLEKIGFSYDWERSFSTADPEFYKWTQMIFLKFYNSYFDEKEQKAKPISELEEKLKKEQIHKGFRCVFSTEIQDENSLKMTDGSNYKKSFYGTISYMPAIFGLYAAAEVIRFLLKKEQNEA